MIFVKKLSSQYNINCMKIKNLTIKFVSRYRNMTYRHYMQQPRSRTESILVKHIKFISEEEKMNYNWLVCKHELYND